MLFSLFSGPKARQEWMNNELQIRNQWSAVYEQYKDKFDGKSSEIYMDTKTTKDHCEIIHALQEIENVGKKKKSKKTSKDQMREFQEKLGTPGLVAAAGSERLDDVKAAMVYAQIDRTLFSQLKNYPEKGVQESTLKVVQCLLILLGYGSESHTIKETFEKQNKSTTKEYLLGFKAVSNWPKCRRLLNYQLRLSIDWLLPGFRTASLVQIDGRKVLFFFRKCLFSLLIF